MSLLIAILDLNAWQWARAASTTPASTPPSNLSFKQVMEHLILFINAHLALRFDNKLAIIASYPNKSELIYSNESGGVAIQSDGQDHEKKKPANVNKQFMVVDDVLVAKIKEMGVTLAGLDPIAYNKNDEHTMMSSSLSTALAYINRMRKNDVNLQARIFVLSVSSDSQLQYISVMNSIFAAKKFNVAIDVCKIFGRESLFLSQAAYSTNGVFEEIKDTKNLIVHLLYSFLPEPSIRKTLALPVLDRFDLRTACLCHRRFIDVAHVCSVCLSIFCSNIDVCLTCKTPMTH